MPAYGSTEGGEHAAPYVLFMEEGEDEHNVTVGSNAFNRQWVRGTPMLQTRLLACTRRQAQADACAAADGTAGATGGGVLQP